MMGHHFEGATMRKIRLIEFLVVGTLAIVFHTPAMDHSRAQAGQNPPLPQEAAQVFPPPAAQAVYDEIAKFISGLPCTTDPLKSLQESAEWKNYAAAMEKNWAELDAKRLQPMKAWAEAEMTEPDAVTKLLFYPFGGPDFLTAFLMFPKADVYVLLGLEFVGKLPDFSKAMPPQVGSYTGNLMAALSDFFNKSYFITKNMNATLTDHKVDGVLPVICFFLEKTDNRIVSMKRCELLETGELLEVDFAIPRKRLRRPYGVKVEFLTNGSDKVRSVYYFSCDLVDDVFRKDSTLYLYLDSLNFETTFVKSASYLMHYKEFSNIRSLILAKSRFVLEDDTGIPYRYFPAGKWEAQLYGEYIKPVSDFSGVEQKDLKEAYADTANVKKLPFHLGYHWGSSKDSVLYFKKKAALESR
jgi:hypothetical protein